MAQLQEQQQLRLNNHRRQQQQQQQAEEIPLNRLNSREERDDRRKIWNLFNQVI